MFARTVEAHAAASTASAAALTVLSLQRFIDVLEGVGTVLGP